MKRETKITLLALTLGVASIPALAQDDTTGAMTETTTTQTTTNQTATPR
ncbi:hypothetical protein [Deinococcus ficus]|nr:hypothetical protein [Deinococcus ficus]